MTTTQDTTQIIAAKLRPGDQLSIDGEFATVRMVREIRRPSGMKVRVEVEGHHAFAVPPGAAVVIARRYPPVTWAEVRGWLVGDVVEDRDKADALTEVHPDASYSVLVYVRDLTRRIDAGAGRPGPRSAAGSSATWSRTATRPTR